MNRAARQQMDEAMRRMARAMDVCVASGDADVDFLAMMIPHHAGAVDMARLVLVHGRDPVTRRLAEDILANQALEMEGMARRLAALRGPVRRPARAYPELGGTRGP